ncbi:hypothetical protein [Rhizobium phage RHph_X2_30]|nr:hypothetical protein [Rhizobium phage RHph_X2_30]
MPIILLHSLWFAPWQTYQIMLEEQARFWRS